MSKQIFLLLLALITSNLLFGADSLTDVLVPYDEEGFYGGSIILILLIYGSIGVAFFMGFIYLLPLIIGVGMTLPIIIKEIRFVIESYYNMNIKIAIRRHLIHLVAFSILILLFSLLVYTVFNPSYLYLFLLIVFGYSSFFGFYIFLYFILALSKKNWIKVLVALILGGGVFLVFAPSGYFVFKPIYEVFL